jgi:hypothetical protein
MEDEVGKKRNAYRLLVGEPEENTPLRRPRRRRVYNIKMNLGQIGWGDVDWIGLAQDRDKWRDLVNTAMNLRVPSNAGKFLNDCTTGGLSSSTQLHGVSQYI